VQEIEHGLFSDNILAFIIAQHIEQALVVTLQACIRDMLGPNLGLDTDDTD
jgi:hypothetical protein